MAEVVPGSIALSAEESRLLGEVEKLESDDVRVELYSYEEAQDVEFLATALERKKERKVMGFV